MGDSLYFHFFQQSQNRFNVNLGWSQQSFTQGCTAQSFYRSLQVRVFHVEYLTNQGETVGVNAAGRQSNDDVAFCNLVVVQNLIFINNAHCETSQVVFVFRVETRHFCSFAAGQGCTGLYAAFCNASYQLCDLFRIVLSACNVVQEQ